MQIPQDVIDVFSGNKGVGQVLSSLLTMSPVLNTGLAAVTGTDLFTGKPVAPATFGSPKWMGQEANHAAQGLITPYKEVATADRTGKSYVETWLEQEFGLKNPTPEQIKMAKTAIEKKEREEKTREKYPQGPIERLGNYLSETKPPVY